MFEKNIYPMLFAIAKTEAKKIAQEAMLEGVKEVHRTLGLEKMLRIEKGEKGKITFIGINNDLQSQIYDKVVSKIHQKIKDIRYRKVSLTLGQILQTNLVSNIGPSIDLKIIPKGSVNVNFIPRLESKGINMVMVVLFMNVHSDLGVILPFATDNLSVEFSYPVAQALIVGDVPEYYFTNELDRAKDHGLIPVYPNKNNR